MKRICFLIICILTLCLTPIACGGSDALPTPAPTAVPTETPASTPQPTPEPVKTLTVREPVDFGTLSARIAEAGTIEAVEIEPGMMSNADAALLLSAFPDVTFRYSVAVGDSFLPPNVGELSAKTVPVAEIAAALPYLPALKTVELGACTPQEIAEAKTLLPGIELEYAVRIYGREVEKDAETLDLSDAEPLDPAELTAALPYLPRLTAVVLGVRDDADALTAFCAANPSLAYEYVCTFTYLGRELTSDTETLDLSGTKIEDLAELRQTIAKLPNLRRIEMIDCGLDNETMAGLCDAYPDVRFIWEVDLGYWGKVRTDATAFSTRSSKTPVQVKNKLKSGKETDRVQYLRYCTDLVALDLGHQSLSDISFLRPLKKLRVLILADNYISDISVLGELPELEYVELFMNRVTDLSPLANLTNLRDLNICSNKVSDFSPLYSVKTLERLWYARNSYSKKDHEKLKEALPDCVLNYTVRDATGDGWRNDRDGHKTERELWKNAFFEGAPRYE